MITLQDKQYGIFVLLIVILLYYFSGVSKREKLDKLFKIFYYLGKCTRELKNIDFNLT